MSDHNDTNNDTTQQPALIRSLLSGSAFPHTTDRPKLVETHISWIVLVGEDAYKIKKPVDLGFLDFSTLERRHHFCAEELRLNRRFAKSLYLGVLPIGGTPDAPVLGSEPAIEWAVHMRRFPDSAGLDCELAGNRVQPAELRHFGETLARAHWRAEVAVNPAYGSFESIRQPALDNFTSLERNLPHSPALREQLGRLREWTESASAALRVAFATRAAAGRVRECHGDLHLGNIVRLGHHFMPFDCLEFDPALRWIDVFGDVGFLVMDLWRHARMDLACEFLNRYLEVSADYDGLRVLRFYVIYRAMVRAKTAALRNAQRPQAETVAVGEYLDLAARIIEPGTRPMMIICHGVSGSGKTWISDRLIAQLPAVRVRSDVVRKQLHDLQELEQTGSELNSGIYGADSSQRTYERVAANAALALRAGLHVIVDATCLRRSDRARFAAAAAACAAPALILECHADPATLEYRVRERHRKGRDASEADIAVLRNQLRRREPLTAAERDRAVTVDTAGAPAIGTIVRELIDCARRQSGTR